MPIALPPTHGGARSLKASILSLHWLEQFDIRHVTRSDSPSFSTTLTLSLSLSHCPSLSLSVSLSSSSAACLSVSQSVSCPGPLRLRPPPQLSKAETRHRRRHCGHDILASVVGFRQAAFKKITKERKRHKSRGEWSDSFPPELVRWEE